MATIPTPLTRSQILGSLIETFLSKYGLKSLKVGTPVLSILEAVAQSQLRASDDIFSMLRGIALEVATGQALDRIGADELTARLPARAASGYVTVGDSSFSKISTSIFQGTSPVIVGSVTVNIADGADLPLTGSVYLGRGTTNSEGPLAYSSIDAPAATLGNYWTLHLSSPTTRFHNVGETVILAQGGDRLVAAGTVVQTPQGPTSSSTTFRTLYSATLVDGEDSLESITVVASLPGLIGNVPSQAITEFSSAPFTGATVSNPSKYSNGRNLERDEGYRERIRQRRRSRSLGTVTALTSASLGVESASENTTVLSNAVVTKEGEPAVLYVDDGSGYEERHFGVAEETLCDYATGGEQYFKTSQQPVSKACSVTSLTAPFKLTSGGKLAFAVGGEITEHTFDISEFSDISNASAYEIAASVNADAGLLWAARTYENGTKVAVFAKADTNDDVQMVAASANDLNGYLGFSAEKVDSAALYKNDLLLTKDGKLATVYTQSFGNWGPLTGSKTLTLEVDGIAMNFGSGFSPFTFQDFIDAGTGYNTLGNNSLEAWAKVFNYRIPGITAKVVGSTVALTSNRGRSSDASVVITGGTLVSSLMFYGAGSTKAQSIGATTDYTLNRNTGEIKLKTPLSAGDRLSLGTSYPRAFLQTPEITGLTFSADAEFWFAVDGEAELVDIGVPDGETLTLTVTAEVWGDRQKLYHITMFDNAQIGDWLILWDTSTTAIGLTGAYRICDLTTAYLGGHNIFIEVAAGSTSTPVLVNGGLAIVRTKGQVQKVTLPYLTGGAPNTYTASTVSSALESVVGATPSVYLTNYVRIRTNSFGTGRDIALVAKNSPADSLAIEPANYTANIQAHLASVESGNGILGTPTFQEIWAVSSSALSPQFNNWLADGFYSEPPAHYSFVGGFPYPDSLTEPRFGNPMRFVTSVESVVIGAPDQYNLRAAPSQSWLISDTAFMVSPYTFRPTDTLTVMMDQNVESGRFTVPFSRKLTPTTSTYGATNTFLDNSNADQSLTKTFGYGSTVFDFQDFAVWMSSRVKIVENATILWRYYRPGADGDGTEVVYGLPAAENASPSLAVDARRANANRVSVILGSGALRGAYSLPTNYLVGTCAPATTTGMTSVYYMIGLKVVSWQGLAGPNRIQVKFQYPDAAITDSGLLSSGLTTFNFVTSGSGAPSGVWDLSTAVITSSGGGINDIYTFTGGTGATAPVVGNCGVMYFSAAGTANFTGVAQYDYLRANAGAGLAAEFSDFTASIQNVPSTDLCFLKVKVPDYSVATSTTISYGALVDPTKFKLFEMFGAPNGMTGTALVAAVNALSNPLVMGTVIASGGSYLHLSTQEFLGSTASIPTMSDGVNYVSTQNTPALISDNYDLTFKNAISGSLSGAAVDWLNEDIYLVPTTPKNVADWMGVKGVTGISGMAEISRSNAGANVQISSLTAGTAGAVEVQGGLANLATAAIIGSVETVGDTVLAYIRNADANGIFAGSWVSVDNANKLPKSGIFDATTRINSWSSGGVITFDAGCTTVTYTELADSETNLAVQVAKHGDFISISDSGLGANNILSGLTTVEEGDYVLIESVSTPQSGFAMESLNLGLFKVLRVNSNLGTIWIKNDAAVEQHLCDCDLRFFDKTSIVPGDTLRIDTAFFGSTFKNVWTVTDSGLSFSDPKKLTVDVDSRTIDTFVDPGAIGSQYPLLHLVEGVPGYFVRQIYSITQSDDSDYSFVKLIPNTNSGVIGSSAGSVLTALDKLAFPTDINVGTDGYAYSTGLIQEVNRVIYGDLSNPSVYPGVAAAGAKINIEGPLVKRITMGFQIRAEKGFSREILANKVKNAAAGVINTLGVGQFVSISDVIKQVQRVVGVSTVVVVSPIYNSANDTLPVQPFEQARVLNVDTDISVVFIGG